MRARPARRAHVAQLAPSHHAGLHLWRRWRRLGMAPLLLHGHAPAGTVPVLLDGRVIGRVPAASASTIAGQLRKLKIRGASGVLTA